MRRGRPEKWAQGVYKVTFPVAFLVSLPLVLFVAWYAWSAYAELDRYRDAVGETVAIEEETFQIALHDELSRDLRRFFLPSRPDKGTLDTFELSLSNDSLDALLRQAALKEKSSYVDTTIRQNGVMHTGRVRARGGQHWHRLGPQKSLKLRVDKGDLIDGVRVFNLINDVTPFGLEEELILDLAREQGLLTPEYRPVRVRINNADMGVYRFEAQPSEGLIRRAGRLPGSIYSGNTDATGVQLGVGELFGNLERWGKSAWPTAGEEKDFSQLERLLVSIRTHSHRELLSFARHELDLDKFALFDALDVVFGGDQHDYVSNQRLFYDAYRGRFEPIAWNFRAFTNDPSFNLVENPLLLRLKSLPEFLWLRDRKVYELLMGPASAAAVRARAEQRFVELQPELESDPYWDAYKLLARSSRFHRFMVRPMNSGRWLLAIQAELRRYSRRTRYLLDQLESPGLEIRAAALGDVTQIAATVDGHAAYRLSRLVVSGPCRGPVRIHADQNGNGVIDPSDPVIGLGEVGGPVRPEAAATWTAGVRLTARPPGKHEQGTVTTVQVPRIYSYLVGAACRIDAGSLEMENLVTGALVRRDFAVTNDAPLISGFLPVADSVPGLMSGEESPHPWTFDLEPEMETIAIGPGRVVFSETQVFETNQRVEIRPGTQLLLGPTVSLVFLGQVTATGTAREPIEIAPSDSAQPFGGILVLGARTAGARFGHIDIRGGSRPQYRAVSSPSLFNIYDTSDITLEEVTISGADGSEDLIHLTYVDGFRLHEISLQGAPVDGIDIEMSQGDIRGARVLWPGDECLDLMGSKIRLVDSLLVGCTNNAVSAGEKTDIGIHGVVIADSEVGVLAKNASTVHLSRSLIYRAGRALRTNQREVHYDAPSRIDAQDLYAVDCEDLKKGAQGINTEDLHRELPTDDGLDQLRGQVLGLADWDGLDDVLAATRPQGSP